MSERLFATGRRPDKTRDLALAVLLAAPLRAAAPRYRGGRYQWEPPEPVHAAAPEQAGERWPAAICGALVIVLPTPFDAAHADACRLCIAAWAARQA